MADSAYENVKDDLAKAEDVKTVPAIMDNNPTTSPAGNGEREEGYLLTDLPKITEKKKKRKPKSQRGINKPTGFEDYHVEGPLTLEEYSDDQDVYNLKLSFPERILTAIQRFERTKKLNSERRDIFYKYLAYGSIEVGPNIFQGRQDVESMDKDEIVTALAQTSLKDEIRNPDLYQNLYVVDFQGCMKGFLSRRAYLIDGFDTQDQVKLVTTTLERFMDYLLLHNVCPEYQDDVLAARDICRAATSELWDGAQALRLLPGDFNIACSTLFDGAYSRNYDGITNWNPEQDGSSFVGMSGQEATKVMHYAVAASAAEDVFNAYLDIIQASKQFQVLQVKQSAGFEITSIGFPSKDCLEIYEKSTTELEPVGRIHAKPWYNPDAPPEDLTAEERQAQVECVPADDHTKYVFFVEKSLLDNLRVGMKIEATIHQLDCGIWFFDEVLRVFPTFDTWLCNELMLGYKKPKSLGDPSDHGEDRAGKDESPELEGVKEVECQ